MPYENIANIQSDFIKKSQYSILIKDIKKNESCPEDFNLFPQGNTSPFMFIGLYPGEINTYKDYNLDKENCYFTSLIKYKKEKEFDERDGKRNFILYLVRELYFIQPEIIFITDKIVWDFLCNKYIILKTDSNKATLSFRIPDEQNSSNRIKLKYTCSIVVTFLENNFKEIEKEIHKINIDRNFVHLHVHNSFSFKDGIGSPENRVAWAVKNKKPAVSTSNHGNISDWIKIYSGCKKYGLKPILGVEAYFNREAEKLRKALIDSDKDAIQQRKLLRRKTNHFTMFAKNLDGFYNIIKIQNDAWINGFYYNPTTSPEVIKNNSKGIICLSGCSSGEQNRMIVQKYHLQSKERADEIKKLIENKTKSMRGLMRTKNDEKYADDEFLDTWDFNWFYTHTNDSKFDDNLYKKEAKNEIEKSDQEQINNTDIQVREIIDWWHNIFKEDYYIELMLIDFEPQILINKELIKIAKEKNIPVVITNDSHYITKEEAKVQQLQMLNDQSKTFDDLEDDTEGKVWTVKSEELYYKTVDELYEAWEKWYKSDIFTEEVFYEGINNVIKIVNKVEKFEIDTSSKLPKLFDNSKKELLIKMTAGLKNKDLYGNKEYMERAAFEYEIICKKGFADYFLILEDIIMWTKNKFGPHSVGPGRGCFVPGSKVRMVDDSIKNIEDIENGDIIISGEGKKREVKNTMEYSIEEELCRIKIGNDVVECTKDHKILVIPKGKDKKIDNAIWKTASKIKPGDILIKNEYQKNN